MTFRVVRPINSTVALVFFGMCGMAPLFILLNGFILIGALLLMIWGATFFGIIEHCLIKRVEIDEKGIKYITLMKVYEMKWQEINMIGVAYMYTKRPGNKPWIYFSGNRVIMPILSPVMVNERFFIVHCRKQIIDAIRKFWPHEILGMEHLKSNKL